MRFPTPIRLSAFKKPCIYNLEFLLSRVQRYNKIYIVDTFFIKKNKKSINYFLLYDK